MHRNWEVQYGSSASMEVQTDLFSILYSIGTNLTYQCIRSVPECWLHLLLISEYGHFLDRSSLLDQNFEGPQKPENLKLVWGVRKHPIYALKSLFWSRIGISPRFRVNKFQIFSNLCQFGDGGPPPRHWPEKMSLTPDAIYDIRLS